MYIWRKAAKPSWLSAHEEMLQARSRDALAVIARPGRRRLQLEIPCKSQRQALNFVHDFGGRIDKLPLDWRKHFLQRQKPRPIRIGKRLIVVGGPREREADSPFDFAQGRTFPYRLIIPAGAAFGTGDHTTTAMSLRLLEQVMKFWGAHVLHVQRLAPSLNASRVRTQNRFRRGAENSTRGRMRSPELVVDLGTGSGILALAARCFGAKHVVGIDNDPTAISVARQNARANKIGNVSFKVADVRRWKPPDQVEIVMANLFSELLMEILPKLKQSCWLILSGILREQEVEFIRALGRSKIEIVEMRRRGKWVALLAKN
jgi:ribosomal protein L11 methyltransferase